MTVAYCIPTARPVAEAEECLSAWKRFGCHIIVWCDPGNPTPSNADAVYVGEYKGYAHAVNKLAINALRDPSMTIVITGGDDVFPDERFTAAQIEREFITHFNGTLGVMQPTGDNHDAGIYDSCAISPWMGREFCRRAYNGAGPLHEGYKHYFVDKELFDVASLLGIYWRRPDLNQRHEHWTRKSRDERKRPEHLLPWKAENQAGSDLYHQRRKNGFPGHELKGAMC